MGGQDTGGIDEATGLPIMDEEAKFALADLTHQLQVILEELDRVPRKSVLHLANERTVEYREKINHAT